jgi:hypothetical protein
MVEMCSFDDDSKIVPTPLIDLHLISSMSRLNLPRKLIEHQIQSQAGGGSKRAKNAE